MADIETTPVTDSGNQVVGKVSILYGTAKAISPDGTVRVLDANSLVYADDRIITESDGSVSIVLNDPAQTHLNIGRMSDIVIDEDVYGGVAPEDVAEAAAEVEEIQQALLAGDDTGDIEMEATAEGGGAASADGGHPVYKVEAEGNEVTPEAFAETEGWVPGTQDTIPGVNEEDVEPEPEPEPEPLAEPEPEPEPVVDTVTLGDVTTVEGSGTATITATLNSNVTGTDLVLTLANGETITIPVGSNTGTSTPFPIQGDDPYVDGESYSVGISGASGGEFADLDITDTAQVTIEDTIDTTTVTLDDVTVDEGSGTATIAASVDNPVTGTDLVLTLDNGATITIGVGFSSGTSTPFAVQGDDVYLDGESYPVAISGASGGNYEHLDTSDTAQVTIEDTIDATYVSITGPANVVEGETTGDYTVTLTNSPQAPVTVEFTYSGVAQDGSDFTGVASIVLAADQVSKTFTIDTIQDYIPEGAESFTVSISDAYGGNFEDLQIHGEANSVDTTIFEPVDTSDTVEESDMDLTQDAGELAASSVTGTTPGEPDESAINQPLNLQSGWTAIASSGSTSLGDYQINADGTYTYTLINPADHSSGPVTDVISYTAEDGNGLEITNTLTITVENDIPMEGDPQDAILANVLGNQVTGDLDFNVGADSEGATYQLINLTNGDAVMNANGNVPVTSDDSPLFWSDDGGGSWSAVTDINDPGNTTAFTVQVNADGTYTVDISGPLILDGAAGVDVVLGNNISGGNDNTVALFDVPVKFMTDVDPADNVPDNADHMFFIMGTDEDGSGSTVNTSQTLGVGSGQDISNDRGSQDGDPSTSETLTIWFAEPEDPTLVTDPDTQLTPETAESVELTLSNWHGTTGAHWVAYNSSGTIVGEGDIADGVTDFLIDTDAANDGTGEGGTVSEGFSKLELTANTESSYKVAAISGVTEVEGSNVVLDLTAEVTDGDGDTEDTDFQVTFDADGNLSGDGVNEVISGVGATSIDGGTGDDTVSYEAATAGVTLDLDDITNVENIVGSDHADTLTGDAGANVCWCGHSRGWRW